VKTGDLEFVKVNVLYGGKDNEIAPVD